MTKEPPQSSPPPSEDIHCAQNKVPEQECDQHTVHRYSMCSSHTGEITLPLKGFGTGNCLGEGTGALLPTWHCSKPFPAAVL